MIQKGASLKEIADVLRHRDLDTSMIYTKINIPLLTQVAMPWPVFVAGGAK
jgi:site-specific recombinase XerD